MNDTDVVKELVQKAMAGDKAAFEELYQETCRSVYFTCLGFIKDEQEAQDVTQDVYLTAFEQLGTLEDAGKFKSWLYRMAANKCINCLKKKQPILPGDEQLQDMETEENENFLPEEYALNEDKREIVLKIIQETCSDVLYQTILLHYFNEFSIAEIAEIMECPEGTVKYRLSVARAKIKEGVLQYEKKSGDKLYSVAVVPFLTALFTAQMQDMQMPVLPLRFPGARLKSTAAAQTAKAAKAGGRIIFKGIQLKIAVAVAAVAVVAGVAAAVTITNQRAEGASVGAQGESVWDAADARDFEDMDTSPETDIDGTQSDGDALQGEAGSADDSGMSDESEDTEKTESKATGTDGKTTTPGEDETAEENQTAETENQATPESEQQYTYTDMSATMYATQTVNIRTAPSTDGEKVGSLSTNQEIAITGQCNETSWYRFEYNGAIAYVSNNYVSENKVEVAAAEPAGGSESAPTQETASAVTSSGLPAGVLDLTTLPREQWVDRGDWLVYVHGVWNEYAIAGQDIGPLESSFNERRPDLTVSGGACKFLRDLGISVSWIEFDGGNSPEAVATMMYYKKYEIAPW